GQVFADRQLAEELHGLERAANSAARDLVSREPVDAMAVVEDRAFVGLLNAGHQIEERALPRSVRSDQPHHGAGHDLERTGGDGAEGAEPLGDTGEGDLGRRYFVSRADGGTGTNLPPVAAATDSG